MSGMHQQELVLVGPNKGKDMKIKTVQFRQGRAWVRGTQEGVQSIVKYCEGFGAVPAEVAEEKQRVIDEYLATQSSAEVRARKAADLKAQLAALETVEEAPVEEPVSDEPEMEAEDGAMENPETSEGRQSESSDGGKASSRKHKNR